MRSIAVAPICIEMGSAFQVNAVLVDEPHEGFVNQSRRLQRVLGAFGSKIPLGQGVALVVHQGHEFFRQVSGDGRYWWQA